jgi:hypothetical protein
MNLTHPINPEFLRHFHPIKIWKKFKQKSDWKFSENNEILIEIVITFFTVMIIFSPQSLPAQKNRTGKNH